MSRKIMLDLFAGTQSVLKAIDEKEWKYFGIDIIGDQNHKLDFRDPEILTKIKILLNGRKPDFIWASPPCNMLSRVIVGKGGNFYFEIDENGDLKPRTNFNINVLPHTKSLIPKTDNEKKAFFQKAQENLEIYANLKKVLKHYWNVKFVVENPQNALSKNILSKYLMCTTTSYCVYGFGYKKPTLIYTKPNNIIWLKKCDHKKHNYKIGYISKKNKPKHHNSQLTSYQNRASVPPKLIKSILEQEWKVQLTMKELIKEE